jgi:SAM-dependent methyltransferase
MELKKKSEKIKKDQILNYTIRKTCRICESGDLKAFLEFGEMPLAGGFVKKEDLSKEKIYPLTVVFCQKCKETQILETVSPEILFKDYRYVSSTTTTLSNHFERYAKTMYDRFLNKKSLVVEFGSNDGVLLEPFVKMGIKAIGVEPAQNIAKLARQKNCEVVNDFFNSKTAIFIKNKYGEASLICANNVFAHIDDIHEPMKGIKLLLKADGVFVFEVHYLLDLLDQFQFDFIYHEHLMYHSLIAISYLLNNFDMEIFDVLRIPIHAGSIRVYAQNKKLGKHAVKPIVGDLFSLEKIKKTNQLSTLMQFSEDTIKKRNALIKLITDLKSKGKRIIGYGASGRATVHINFCKFDSKIIEYVIDESHERQGRFIPGMQIPIVPPNYLTKDNPDYALLFAYNYFDEVMEKEKDFIERGGRFIVPLPEPKIIEPLENI